jgi:hypothetical protein
MRLDLSVVRLATQNLNAMANFLGQLMDGEVRMGENSCSIDFQQTRYEFFIPQGRTTKSRMTSQTSFEFHLDNHEELKAFNKKVDFFLYRYQDSGFQSKSSSGNIQLTDPDGRIWNYTLQENSAIVVVEQDQDKAHIH